MENNKLNDFFYKNSIVKEFSTKFSRILNAITVCAYNFYYKFHLKILFNFPISIIIFYGTNFAKKL